MKRIMTLITITLAIGAIAAAGERRIERSHMDGELTEYLQLTPAQQAAWQSVRSDFETANQPLFEKQRGIGQQLETALKSGSTDACGIGSLLISQQGVLDQIKASHEALHQKLESILTPDQKTKFEAFKAIAPMKQRMPMHPEQ